jgi:hypothetical protein
MKTAATKAILALAISFLAWGADGDVGKTPGESFDVSLDFAKRAASISLVSCTAIEQHKHTNSTSVVIAYSPAPAVKGTKVIWRVQGGNSGELHLISVKVTNTATGETLEGSIMLHVS